MISYDSSDVIQCLRQYDMFANSLKLIRTKEERDMVIKQLTKLENKIISLTNEIYEEEYLALYNKECSFIEEEKNRITMLIDLINQRLSYVEKRCNNHYQLTGESINADSVLGTDTLDDLEDRIKIINKYIKNIKLEKELQNDVKSLSSKIALASEKIDINASLNIELENTLKRVLGDAIEKNNFYTLLENKDEIYNAYEEIEKSLNLAKSNLNFARTSPKEIYEDCEKMLRDVEIDYDKYKEQVSILKLLDIFNKEVNGYEELLDKRKEINELMKYIKDRSFLDSVKDIIDKQYSTIMMEQQDVNTLNDLVLEKERKLEALSEISEEDSSSKFQEVLKPLIENEKKRQAAIENEQRRIEEEEKKKRLEVERKRQEEILKRQRVIEEARKKEIEKRTKELLEQQQNSVLQTKKNVDDISFTSIKDSADNHNEIVSNEKINDTTEFNNLSSNINEKVTPEEKTEEPVIFKNKVDIEKELFDEFENRTPTDVKLDEDKIDININDIMNDSFNNNDNNKLPEGSIDDYMKNFNENKVNNISNLFDEDMFPNIPV